MVYSNSYMFLGLGVFVLLSSHVLAYNMRADASIYDSTLDDQKSINYVKVASTTADHNCPPGPTYPELSDSTIDDQKSIDYVKGASTAGQNCPPGQTYPELSDATLNDQKSIDHVKDASTNTNIVDHNCPPGPPTYFKLSAWVQDDQNSINKVKGPKTDQGMGMGMEMEHEDIEDEETPNKDGPTEEENIPSEPEVDWRTFHAKYPWIKKNDPNTVSGSRKLLNDIAIE